MGDINTFHYLISLFNADAYRHFEIPYWNPYIFSGMPWSCGLENKVFFLPEIIASFFPGFSYGFLKFELFFFIFLAGLGVFVWAKSLNTSNTAAFFSGISFMSSGIFVANAGHFGQIVVYALSPWIFWLLQKMVAAPEPRLAIGAAFCLTLALTGGYPGTVIVLLYLIGFVMGLSFFISKHPKKLFKIYLLWGLLTAGLSAAFLLPALFFFKETVRHNLTLSFKTIVTEHALAPANLLSLLAPSLATNTHFLDSIPDANILMSNVYMGALALPCAAAAFFWDKKRRRLIMIIIFISLFCLLAAMGAHTPVRPWMFHAWPLMDKIRLSSSIFRGFFLLGFCLLAGFGVDALMELKNSFKKFGMPLIYAVAGFLILKWTVSGSAVWPEVLGEWHHSLLILCFFWLILLALERKIVGKTVFFLLVSVLLVADFSYAVSKNDAVLWQKNPAALEWIESLQSQRDRSFSGLQNFHREKKYPLDDNLTPLFFRVRSDGGFLGGDGGAQLFSYAQFMKTKAHRILTDGPQAWFLSKLCHRQNGEEVLRELDRDDLNPEETGFIVFNSDKKTEYSYQKSPEQSFRILKYGLNKIVFQYSSPNECYLVLNEVYDDSWRARFKSSGQRIPVERVDAILRGMTLPKGEAVIEMSYDPPIQKVGIWMSLATLAGLLAFFLSNFKGLRLKNV